MGEIRKGRQTPTQSVVLPYSSTYGAEAIDIYNSTGRTAQEWQELLMTKLEGNIDLGDIVGGKDYLTGISMKKPIGRKIWTISSGKEKVVYKLEGET